MSHTATAHPIDIHRPIINIYGCKHISSVFNIRFSSENPCSKIDFQGLYWKGNGKVTFTRPFLMFSKVTFGEHGNVMERYCKSGILYSFMKS